MQERSKTEPEDREGTDSLTDLIRTGAQQLLAQALKAEVAELLATYADQRDEQGHARVVLSGHHPKRDIQTGVGPVTVQVPKVRSRQGKPVTFRSAFVPPYVRKTASLEAAIPWFYAVEDRAPRVYPWVNEPGGGTMGRWKSSRRHTVFTGYRIMWCGCASTAAGS